MSLLTARPVILASASPRRLDLLRQVDIEPQVLVPQVEELDELHPGLSPQQLVLRNARAKAEAVCEQRKGEDALIIAADTVVVQQGVLFGKPTDEEDARRMLRELSDSEHSVFTGHCVMDALNGRQLVECSETKVRFIKLSEEEIDAYIKTGEPSDKAGAYGMQSRGGLFVSSISGDHSTVVGLSLPLLYRLLRQLEQEDKTEL